MNAIRKTLSLAALGGISVGTYYGLSTLVQDVKFSRAEQQVQSSREQLQTSNDISTVYRNVGKVVEPSVVMIEVQKTVKTAGRQFNMSPDMLKRFFPDRDGDGQPDLPNGMQMPDGDDSPNPNGGETLQQGEGSGVIMEVNGGTGFILTNNHVAGGATKMKVTLSDGREITDVKLVGADPKSDLAVVEIKADKLIPAKWGDSGYLEKGDMICAFGSPFGYVGSMTHGIVSSLNRDHVGIINSQFAYENFIQVDAPINPGNSGGPLVNLHGEVVGINTAIASNTGSFNGIGFAIPSNLAKPVYEQLKTTGKITRGWLGVEIANVGESRLHDMVNATGYTGTNGVFVPKVMNNTPATGKLQAGDIVTAIDGKKVDNVTQLRGQIAVTKPNTDVKLEVFRNGKTEDVTIKLGEQPDDVDLRTNRPSYSRNRGNGSNNSSAATALGLKMSTPNEQTLKRYNLADDATGALITSVDPNSTAAQAGIVPGDLITKIGDTPVTTSDDAAKALNNAKLSEGVRMYITGHDGERFVFLKTEGK